ncbi:MAG: type I methionyl aminopeptidase [Syntrophotaleaceae bacterium]
MIVIKSRAELEKMRDAGKIVAEILEFLKERVKPGITTIELDRLAEVECRKRGARPAFKGYGGFPYSICASPDEKVVHGFPDQQPLAEGSILSIDFGVIYQGFYGDSAFTMGVGKVPKGTQRLVDTTRQSLEAGIAQVEAGHYLSDISRAVQACAEKEGFSVVREFVGHGIGRALHEEPQIPNFVEGVHKGPLLKVGMTLAIEPMINEGVPGIRILSDGWTAVTQDGRLSAHFEHTVAITENGADILTRL